MRRKRWAMRARGRGRRDAPRRRCSARRRARAPKLTKVTLQLKWVTQAQFAGYYAAAAQGYYKNAGLDVKIKVGGPNITPGAVVIGGGADIGLDWLPNLFATARRAAGSSRSPRSSPAAA